MPPIVEDQGERLPRLIFDVEVALLKLRADQEYYDRFRQYAEGYQASLTLISFTEVLFLSTRREPTAERIKLVSDELEELFDIEPLDLEHAEVVAKIRHERRLGPEEWIDSNLWSAAAAAVGEHKVLVKSRTPYRGIVRPADILPPLRPGV